MTKTPSSQWVWSVSGWGVLILLSCWVPSEYSSVHDSVPVLVESTLCAQAETNQHQHDGYLDEYADDGCQGGSRREPE